MQSIRSVAPAVMTRGGIELAVRIVVEDGLPYRPTSWHRWRDHRVFVPFTITVFGDVPHQSCKFHVLKEFTQGILRAVAAERHRWVRPMGEPNRSGKDYMRLMRRSI